MKKINLFLTVAILLGAIIFYASCSKEEVNTTTNELTEISDDDALADDLFDDILSQGDSYGTFEKSGYEKGACTPEITKTAKDSFPRTVTIDFGTTDCEGRYGHLRRGKIIITESAKRTETGATSTFTLQDYYVDGYKIEGTRTVTNMSDSINGLKVGITLIGGKITTPEGKEITRTATRARTLVEGQDTPLNLWDDKWSITGEASGVNRNGKSYTSIITDALLIDRSCKFKLTKGIVTITSDKHILVINYGDGSCDNETKITIDGVEQTSQL